MVIDDTTFKEILQGELAGHSNNFDETIQEETDFIFLNRRI